MIPEITDFCVSYTKYFVGRYSTIIPHNLFSCSLYSSVNILCMHTVLVPLNSFPRNISPEQFKINGVAKRVTVVWQHRQWNFDVTNEDRSLGNTRWGFSIGTFRCHDNSYLLCIWKRKTKSYYQYHGWAVKFLNPGEPFHWKQNWQLCPQCWRNDNLQLLSAH